MKLVVLGLFVVVSAAVVGLLALASPGSPGSSQPAPVAVRHGSPGFPPGVASSPALPPRAERPAGPPGLTPVDDRAPLGTIDAAARRAAKRAELEASGRTTAAWTRRAADVFGAGAASGPHGPIDVRFGAMECFAAGCMTTATYGDFAAFNALNQALPESEAFRLWQGSKMRTPPEQLPDGRVVADWVLFPPEGDDQLAMRKGESQ